MPRPRWCSRFSALLLAAAGTGALLAQRQPSFKVNVNLVHILATVKNAQGQLVGSLEKGDFEVYDNGAKQDIAVFERRTAQPLSIALLVDTSGSTAIDLKYEMESVQKFFKALLAEGNPEDRVALYSFNYVVTRQNFFTHNLMPLERSLKNLRSEAGTALYDAIYLAARDLEDREGRKVLVVVTDGGDTFSRIDFQGAVKAAQMADAVIYPVVVIPVKADAGRNVGGENALTTMAQWTGGRTFTPSIGPTMDAAFEEIIRELRTQYLLAYYPKNVPLTKEKFHHLTIQCAQPALRVVARNGYYGDSEGDTGTPDARVSVDPEPRRRSGETVRR